KADVKAEGDMALGEPASAGAVIDRPQPLLVSRRGRLPVRNNRPLRRADSAADVAPAVPVPEIQRELRGDVDQPFGHAPPDDLIAALETRRMHPRHRELASEAEGHRLPPENIDMRTR